MNLFGIEIMLFMLLSAAHVKAKDTLPDDDKEAAYRFQMDFGTDEHLCPKPQNRKCGDGSYNFMCNKTLKPSSACIRYGKVKITTDVIINLANGHNGMRNEVASKFGITNMHLIYWSAYLQDMAERYLLKCTRMKDTCLLIGKKHFVVNQNVKFMERRKPFAHKNWPGRIIRAWYHELGMGVDTWPQLVKKIHGGQVGNFTQMIWPTVEFFGCGAATMFNGYLVVCYYYPSMDITQLTKAFEFATPCHCPQKRDRCSKLFLNLCGIDFKYVRGGAATLSAAWTWQLCFAFYILINY